LSAHPFVLLLKVNCIYVSSPTTTLINQENWPGLLIVIQQLPGFGEDWVLGLERAASGSEVLLS